MKRSLQKQDVVEIAVRVFADILIVNAALLCALALRYLWLAEFPADASEQVINIKEYIDGFRSSVWIMTLLSLVVFYASGFYTHGRRYRGRYKALVIAQAVTLTYLIFALLLFFVPSLIALPRGVVAIAWALTLIFLIGARLWSMLWKTLI